MTQLILDMGGNAVTMPESKKGGYRVARAPLSVNVEMISGRMVRELRGNVWVIAYQYGWFDDETKNKVIESCEKGRREPIRCSFLPPDSNEMIVSEFFVTDFAYPTFFWSRKTLENGEKIDVPMWGNFSVELREVKPRD
jgi:hypothetical protein